MAKYTPAAIAAMNKQGRALLDSQKNGTYKPPNLTSASAYANSVSNQGTTLGRSGSRPNDYIPKPFSSSGTYISSAGLGNQKVGSSSGGSYSPPPTPENPRPDWLPPDTPDWWGGEDPNGLIDLYADNQTQNLLQSLRSAFDQQRTDLYAQKPMIEQEAQEMRNSADTNYYQSLPDLYKAMEAGGQRGGENITGMVGLGTMRGQGRNNADLFEANQLRNIDNTALNLGSQQAQAEAETLAGIGADTFSARIQAMRDAVAQAQKQREQERSDYMDLIGAYSDNYMQEINNLRSQGVPDTDYRIRALRAARNQKITGQNEAAYEAQKDAEANALAWARINRSGSSNTSLTPKQRLDLLFKEYSEGLLSDEEYLQRKAELGF